MTAAMVDDGLLSALSAAFNTLLTIDPSSRSVPAAHAIRGLQRPTGIAIKDASLYVLGADATVTVIAKPGCAVRLMVYHIDDVI